MKELNRIILEKGILASIKGHLFLTKGHLDNPEGPVDVESPLIERCFWHIWFKLAKAKFFKNGIFNEASDPWTLYFFKMDPGFIQSIFKRSLFPCSPTGCFWVVSWNELSVKKRCLDVTFTTITQCKNLT